jgi:uncharacterized protein (TIGR03066 family)
MRKVYFRWQSHLELSMRLRPVAALTVLALLALAVTPALAADKPQDLIIGKWQPADAKEKANLEFLKDGKLKIGSEQFMLDGTYKFLDDKTLEVKISFMGQEKAVKLNVTVTKDELTTQETGKDKKETFKRVK